MQKRTTDFQPIVARTRTLYRPMDPVAYDCVQVIVIRDGSAIMFSEFGQSPATVGDVIALGANTLCGSDPEGHLTITAVRLDTDYVVDQVFWQNVGVLHDRLNAQDFAAKVYSEPAQILHVGEEVAGSVMPWLDELTALTSEHRPVQNFYRLQALWSSVAHVIVPFIKTSSVRTSPTQRARTWPTSPRHRPFEPLRCEALRAAELLRAEPERRWSVTDLATEVHLSRSQLGRVFVEAFGKSPIAFLTMLRTERMAALLRVSDTPIALIAEQMGWSDPDFAARQFRRSVGVTPSNYRALSRLRAAPAIGEPRLRLDETAGSA